ncbi:putative DNA-binding transcriptional regulator [Virgibacillus natechei]|uniref:DNA-binding transcriptional regulator n=1 Tax=Virgibacillus natechei TaxID=1216297 RepID=A0ABS4IGF6_9BACI|nr:helix-turn-helix domain-containing protein [Virgibacillus natechei]MBP1970024.1 putative DNA-binding transcriptional regulator [Virgibacillus natechei]UZD13321.1 helix-turn-helix domain-containing protein [Virgibacillus natechei]
MEELRGLETFETVQEMDNATNEALTYFDLKTSERDILLKLSQYSCKFVGVSYMKVRKLAQEVKLSERTVKRALKRLSELGIITRVKQLRPVRGGWGASITVINPSHCHIELAPRPEEETPEGTSSKGASSRNETIYFKAIKIIKELRQPEGFTLDYSYLEAYGVPAHFIGTVKPFINPEEAFSLWGKVQACWKRYAPDVTDILEPAIQAFKASVTAYKFKRIKRSFGAYFWGTLRGVFTVEQRKQLSASNLLGWNWLTGD